jgi:hypothetical protein
MFDLCWKECRNTIAEFIFILDGKHAKETIGLLINLENPKTLNPTANFKTSILQRNA